MSRNGSGGYSLPVNSWNPAVNGVSATAADWQSLINDVATALQQSVSADGQTPITGNLAMGGNKLTGLGVGVGTGQSLRFEQLFSQGTLTSIASATTTDIGAQLSNFLQVTGTTTITSFGTNYNGPRFLIFSGALVLTHSATLVLPGAANITTVANDCAIAIPISGGWQVVAYQRASGFPVVTTGFALSGANSDITSLAALTSINIGVANTGRLIATTVYTASGTYTKATNNPSYVEVEVVGGGGGGGGSSFSASCGGGGGGGGYSRKRIAAASLSASETVTVGAAGAAGASGGTGGAGGTSSFGAHASATGGGGGVGATSLSFWAGGAYGTGASGDVNTSGQPGGPGQANVTSGYTTSGFGGASIFGGGGAPVVNNANAAGGAAAANSGSGGGGGSAGASGQLGGVGGAGRVIVREYA